MSSNNGKEVKSFIISTRCKEIRNPCGHYRSKETGNKFTDITFTVAILTKIIIGAGKNRRSTYFKKRQQTLFANSREPIPVRSVYRFQRSIDNNIELFSNINYGKQLNSSIKKVDDLTFC